MNVSELVRRAIVSWFQTLPEDLPLDLRAAITRSMVLGKISTIRDIRYLYHSRNKAAETVKALEQTRRAGRFPTYVIDQLVQLERELIDLVRVFDEAMRDEAAQNPDP